MKRIITLFCALAAAFAQHQASACTGISLKASDGSIVLSRTIEWGESELNSEYVIVPRNTEFVSYTPTGHNGLAYKAKYGFVGISVVQKDFIAEGVNEKGLSAGLFYFPGYGKYPDYDSSLNASTISDLQVVSWILSSFSSVSELEEAIDDVRITILEGAATVHWRIADRTGRQVVLEILDGVPHIFENTVGVLTNAPDFRWQVTNLNNYVNLYPGQVSVQDFDTHVVHPFGAGAGMLGLPGDITPPSRFVRAFFYRATAPVLATGEETVVQSFKILNNFDIPIGLEFSEGKAPALPSATQWTVSVDLSALKLYYRTMYDSSIRCVDLNRIDFSEVSYVSFPLDDVKKEKIVDLV